jgi:hypothetical protein
MLKGYSTRNWMLKLCPNLNPTKNVKITSQDACVFPICKNIVRTRDMRFVMIIGIQGIRKSSDNMTFSKLPSFHDLGIS